MVTLRNGAPGQSPSCPAIRSIVRFQDQTESSAPLPAAPRGRTIPRANADPLQATPTYTRRLSSLVKCPLSHVGRMLASPFTFYRGAAAIMAADLAPSCSSAPGPRSTTCTRCSPSSASTPAGSSGTTWRLRNPDGAPPEAPPGTASSHRDPRWGLRICKRPRAGGTLRICQHGRAKKTGQSRGQRSLSHLGPAQRPRQLRTGGRPRRLRMTLCRLRQQRHLKGNNLRPRCMGNERRSALGTW